MKPILGFEIILFSIADLSCVAETSDRANVAAPPEDFYQKSFKPLKLFHIDIHRILDF